MKTSVLPVGVSVPLLPHLPQTGGGYTPKAEIKEEEEGRETKYLYPANGNGSPKRVKAADRLTSYDSGNATAAALILADPAAHGGLESLACRWAEAWPAPRGPHWRCEAGERFLFRGQQ